MAQSPGVPQPPPPPVEKTGAKLTSAWWGGSTVFVISQIYGVLENLVINGVHINQPHTGVDIVMPVDTALYNPVHAVVSGAGVDKYGNRFVKLTLDNGDQVLLLHLHDVVVKVGDQLNPGSLLGHSGNSGLSTGAHLHFEVQRGGKPIDPFSWLTTQATPFQPSVSNPIQGIDDLAKSIGAFFTPQTAWKIVFIPLGLTIIGLGVFIYFFKEEASGAGQVAKVAAVAA